MNANNRGFKKLTAKGSVPHVFGNKVLPDAQPRRLCHTILYRSAEISVDQCDSGKVSKSHVCCAAATLVHELFLRKCELEHLRKGAAIGITNNEARDVA